MKSWQWELRIPNGQYLFYFISLYTSGKSWFCQIVSKIKAVQTKSVVVLLMFLCIIYSAFEDDSFRCWFNVRNYFVLSSWKPWHGWFCILIVNFNIHSCLLCLQVSRSIGDVYLKKTEYNREPLYAKFRLREPFRRPILSSEPSISVLELQPYDQFLIFASDGLWEHLSNQDAVDIVQNHPRSVSYLSLIWFPTC